MRKIYTLGETVYDIIFNGDKIENSCVGGSVVNTSVSLGRIGLPIYLISQFSKDYIGKIIESFLNDNYICTDYIYKYSNNKTPLALAFLDEEKNAKYEFYKEKIKKNLDIENPDFQENDILLFGSFFSINFELKNDVIKIVKEANEKNCVIIYDPNFRNPNKPDLDLLISNVRENIKFSNIIRGSKDDFQNIFGFSDPIKIYLEINDSNKILIITDAGNQVEVLFGNYHLKIPLSKLNPFSTIGAGDNFNAGLIFALYKFNINRNDLKYIKEIDLKVIINYGIKFAQNVCMSFENYISLDFAKKIK